MIKVNQGMVKKCREFILFWCSHVFGPGDFWSCSNVTHHQGDYMEKPNCPPQVRMKRKKINSPALVLQQCQTKR